MTHGYSKISLPKARNIRDIRYCYCAFNGMLWDYGCFIVNL